MRSDPASFAEARRWIVGIARDAGEGIAWGRPFALALHEAMTNIHRHAYRGRRDGRIDIRAEIGDDAIEVRLRDYGRRFDLESYVEPDLDEPLVEGGYGLVLMRASVDEVRHAVMEHGTEILLRKRRTTVATLAAATAGPTMEHADESN
jgi:serine/threonine-protein kinase RsbW